MYDNSFTAHDWGCHLGRFVMRLEQVLGSLGWPATCFTLAAFVVKVSKHEVNSSPELWRELSFIGIAVAVLGTSVLMRGPSRWLPEVGFKLGYQWTALFSCAALLMALFAPNSGENIMIACVFIVSAQISASLCAFTAWRWRRHLAGK
jgi:hypothetical protein